MLLMEVLSSDSCWWWCGVLQLECRRFALFRIRRHPVCWAGPAGREAQLLILGGQGCSLKTSGSKEPEGGNMTFL